MNINETSELTGLSKDMIRFYEKQGLIYPRRNNENNYRSYDQTDLNLLVLIKQYSALGIELKVIQSLINDYNIDHALDSFNNKLKNWIWCLLGQSKIFKCEVISKNTDDG